MFNINHVGLWIFTVPPSRRWTLVVPLSGRWHRGIPTSRVPLPHIARTSSVAPRSSPSSGDPPFSTRGTGSLAPLAAVAVAAGEVGPAVYHPLLVVETELLPPDGQGSGPRSAHLRRWGIVGVLSEEDAVQTDKDEEGIQLL
ncbi:hypothetical protein EOD39_12646 [Acipenser ruthenus]|uniref:Uncharacterized protein n=1 Tax=Acipenser ruthenus TaxID=7906 RepID=A0A662YRT9_ACIRT|nr:hypothetical protein EOD39_12646 [Acipenser ruthenus]